MNEKTAKYLRSFVRLIYARRPLPEVSIYTTEARAIRRADGTVVKLPGTRTLSPACFRGQYRRLKRQLKTGQITLENLYEMAASAARSQAL